MIDIPSPSLRGFFFALFSRSLTSIFLATFATFVTFYLLEYYSLNSCKHSANILQQKRALQTNHTLCNKIYRHATIHFLLYY